MSDTEIHNLFTSSLKARRRARPTYGGQLKTYSIDRDLPAFGKLNASQQPGSLTSLPVSASSHPGSSWAYAKQSAHSFSERAVDVPKAFDSSFLASPIPSDSIDPKWYASGSSPNLHMNKKNGASTSTPTLAAFSSQEQATCSSQQSTRAMVLWGFGAQHSQQLSVARGQVVEAHVSESGQGPDWVRVTDRSTGKTGFIPAACIKPSPVSLRS